MDQAQSLRDIMNRQTDTGVQVITVTSAKGGVGKTSVALNMAIALHKRGRRPLLVDMDVGLSNVDVMMGLKTKYNLSDVINRGMRVTDIIERSPFGINVISGGSGLTELINMPPPQLHRIIGNLLNLRDAADTILFDTSSGISDHIIRLVCASHMTWLITTPEPTAIMDAYALLKQVSLENTRPCVQLVVNRADHEKEAASALDGFVQIANKYMDTDITGLGHILNDQHMGAAIKRQVPLLVCYPNCTAAQNIERLADRFLHCAPSERAGFTGFLERLFGKSINSQGFFA